MEILIYERISEESRPRIGTYISEGGIQEFLLSEEEPTPRREIPQGQLADKVDNSAVI